MSLKKPPRKEYQNEELEQYDFAVDDFIDKRADDLAPAIGMFLIVFSELEYDVSRTIADLMSITSHDIGYMAIQELTMSQKLNVMGRIVRWNVTQMGLENLEIFNEICKEIVVLYEFRNEIAHALWNTLDKEDFVRVRVISDKRTGAVEFRKRKMTPEIIGEMQDLAIDVNDRFFEILQTWELV